MGIEVRWADLDNVDEAIFLSKPPTILLRRRQSRREERWAVFHALGHLRLHRGNQFALSSNGRAADVAKQERQAEEWAADLLMPRSDLLEAIVDGAEAEEIADLFDVPFDRVAFAISLLGRR